MQEISDSFFYRKKGIATLSNHQEVKKSDDTGVRIDRTTCGNREFQNVSLGTGSGQKTSEEVAVKVKGMGIS